LSTDLEFSIEVFDLVAERDDRFNQLPEGETATIVTKNVQIGEAIEGLIPRYTSVSLIASTSNGYAYYLVTTRGYKIAQFVAVVDAYARGDIGEASRLIEELRPPEIRKL